MRNVWLLGGLATVLTAVALAIVLSTFFSSSDDDSVDLVDREQFTVDLVQQALERYDRDGRDGTLKYYNSPESASGEWYIFILDAEGTVVAHINQSLLGRGVKEGLGVDATGYRFGEVMLGATEDGLWVDYVFFNPKTGKQDVKHSWVVRHDGLIFGSGWYEGDEALWPDFQLRLV